MKYVEIFIESIVVYFYLVTALRFLGKKEMSQLTIFDFIVFLLISELMTISIGNEEVDFFQGALSVFVIVVLFSFKKMIYVYFMSISILPACMSEGHISWNWGYTQV